MLLRTLPFLMIAFAASGAGVPELTYSTYLRDNFTPTGIATDPGGNIYLTGNVTIDPPNSRTSVLVVKLNPQATQLLYTRYIAGSVGESAAGIAVDTAGNAYIAGTTNSPDFPVTSTAAGTAPGASSERSFVTKLDANGTLVYSMFLGGSVNSYAQAIAVNSAGQAVVSGLSVAAGFPSTPGVYSVSDTSSAPYLVEVNATGTSVIFSATGIGGNVLAIDSAGNIYMAGTTGSLTYPTTPGTYQPNFPVFQTCIAPCHGFFQGPNQYVTKLDPTGTKIIYSTAVSGTGNTQNNGLAVDSGGNVYVTGFAGVGYPYTVAVPTPPGAIAISKLETPSLPFLTKLDPLGQKVLYSVPVGGAGVRVDANGNAYVGGILGSIGLYDIAAALPALANIPVQCLGVESSVGNEAYVTEVDPNGVTLATQLIGGTTLILSGTALAGNTLWVAGETGLGDFPFSAGAIVSPNLRVAFQRGAYLGAVQFGAGTAGPQIACVVDSAGLRPTGPLAPGQLITIYGSGLAAATATAQDYATTNLGGVSVTVGAKAATLLYVSANQVNLAVPLGTQGALNVPETLTISVNGAASTLGFPVASENPTVFTVPGSYHQALQEFQALALNADGSVNSASNPAALGSTVSVFVDGMAGNPYTIPTLLTSTNFAVKNYALINPFVLQVSMTTPTSTANQRCGEDNPASCAAVFELFDFGSYLYSPTGGLRVDAFVYVAAK